MILILPFTQDSHGRDNKLHVWTLLRETAAHVRDAASQPGLPTPSLRYSMDVNALNYCRFSLMPLPTPQNEERSALIALPNLIESSLVSPTVSFYWLLFDLYVLGGHMGAALSEAIACGYWKGWQE